MNIYFSCEINQINRGQIQHSKFLKVRDKNYQFKVYEDDKIVECVEDDNEKFLVDKQLLLQNVPYRFFEPFCYYDSNNVISIATHALGDEYNFDLNNIEKIKEKNVEYDAVKFLFNIKWVENRVDYILFFHNVVSKNFDNFRQQFETFFFNKSFSLINFSISNQNNNYYINNFYLCCNTTFDLSATIKFPYQVDHKDFICLKILKKNANKVLEKKFCLNLPCKSYVEKWSNDIFYFPDDIVFLKKDEIEGYYKCKIANKDKMFDFNKWEKENNMEVSFSNYSCFLNSNFGKECLNLLNKSLSMLVSTYLGKKITLYLGKFSLIPNINNFFFYKNIKYRVIKTEHIIDNGKNKLKIYGLEYIKINDNINAIQWIEDSYFKIPKVESLDSMNEFGIKVDYQHLIKQNRIYEKNIILTKEENG